MGKITKYFISYHLPWQVLMLTIFVLSSIPSDDLPDLQFRATDKIAHVLLFGVLAFLLLRSFEHSRHMILRGHAAVMAITAAALYGALDEMHQLLVAGRFASFWDWIADLIGAVLFVSVYLLIRHRRPVRLKNRKS